MLEADTLEKNAFADPAHAAACIEDLFTACTRKGDL